MLNFSNLSMLSALSAFGELILIFGVVLSKALNMLKALRLTILSIFAFVEGLR